MKKSILIFVKTTVVFGMFFIAGCGKGGEPEVNNEKDLEKVVPDPKGTITVKMRNCDYSCTPVYPEGCDYAFYIGNDNNFYGFNSSGYYTFARIGKVAGLGNITTIPDSGFANSAAVEPGCGYVARNYKGTYVRIYVVAWIESTSGGIIGAEIKYQSPFEPTAPVDPKPTNPNQTDTVIVINGVKWATRNVDAFGTFAATPQSAGKFYQWNRKKAWSATTPAADIAIGGAGGWDNTYPTGTTWEKANDPSPKGWRVPTKEEMDKLFDTEKVTNVWTTQNNVKGRKFTDKATGTSVFFPAAGFRYHDDGTLYDAGTSGHYWSGTENGSYGACNLLFDSGYATVHYDSRTCGFSVRSVAD